MSELETKFAIYRILGNELPPRDLPGSRLKVLQWILEKEPRFPDSRRFWILNRIADPVYLEKVKTLLNRFREKHHEIPFDLNTYARQWTSRTKILYAIPINYARNLAVESGKQQAEFTLVLDGDCVLTEEAWKGMVADMAKNPTHAYYSLPMKRIALENVMNADKLQHAPWNEPQLIFGREAEWGFNEQLLFGQQDKMELLVRLGHNPEFKKSYELLRTDLCARAGYVLHLHTGEEESEANMHQRHVLRQQSIQRLIHQLDQRVQQSNSMMDRMLSRIGACGRNLKRMLCGQSL